MLVEWCWFQSAAQLKGLFHQKCTEKGNQMLILNLEDKRDSLCRFFIWSMKCKLPISIIHIVGSKAVGPSTGHGITANMSYWLQMRWKYNEGMALEPADHYLPCSHFSSGASKGLTLASKTRPIS